MSTKKLKIAVIGCSIMGQRHMQGVENKDGTELYAICDSSTEQLEARKKEFPNVNIAVTDYRELVNMPELDAVVIVTPDKLHLEMTEAFLRAGKDVLCEKPMALTMSECEQMLKAEKETGKRLMIGQVCRCTPSFVMAKSIVDSGKIGELYFVESEYAHNYSAGSRGYNDWRVDPERHAVIGGGCHAIDLLRWIAGNPTEVYSYANHKCLTDWPVDDCSLSIYQFPNNIMGKVFVSIGCKRDYTMRSAFYGTKGTIICDNTSPDIILYEGDNYEEPQKIPVVVNNHNVVEEISDFVDAIISDGDMPVSSIEGANTIAVCCATVEAANTHRPVQIKYPKVK